ncbi:ATP-binding cassette transporter, partial [Coprinopsis sp. MPI-PUGE-AT-0042]
MFRFQFEVASILLAGTGASAMSFWWNTKTPEGMIQLPLHCEDLERDPFDVTTPMDLVDGHPIEEQEFWEKMRRSKTIITALCFVAVGLNAAAIGFALANEKQGDLVVGILHLLFALYLVIISARSVVQDDPKRHCESIIHIASLSFLATFLLVSVAILPNAPASGVTPDHEHALQRAWYALVLSYAAICVLGITTPTGPPLHFPPDQIYSEKTATVITNPDLANVCGLVGASIWGMLVFSYATKVIWLSNDAESLETGDLPVVPRDMRAAYNYARVRRGLRRFHLRVFGWKPPPGSGWSLAYMLVRLNLYALTIEMLLAVLSGVLFYAPAFFVRLLIGYLESDPKRERPEWGWVYVFGLLMAHCTLYLVTGQLWALSAITIPVRLRVQLNTALFAKTLVRKDVASPAPSPTFKHGMEGESQKQETEDVDNDSAFSSKAQIMNLMTTDVDRVGEFAWHFFTLIDSPMEIAAGAILLYSLLGISSFFGLAVMLLLMPISHLAANTFVNVEENLMKARDERMALMNEILGAIRMLKFMAWERSFEKKVMKIREKELKYQGRRYRMEVFWNFIFSGSPILVTLVAFWHYTIIRQQPLTPSVAFTSLIVLADLKYALAALPETIINMVQCLVSVRRIEKYLDGAEVKSVPPLSDQSTKIAFQSCTVTWPNQDRSQSGNASSTIASASASTPHHKFILMDLNLEFPRGELSLICGKLGCGKTLMLLALLGEADILTGQVVCPRSPPDAIALSSKAQVTDEDWVVEGMCAYVPQTAWLRNASIKDNILFCLPYDEERYNKTLKACALVSDLRILEDGDESEIGEQGVNLSGGQKARVSLARAVYSRASILFLDDVLSAVDAHTANHLYHQCLRGDLMQGRTVILASHHVQLCSGRAAHIVALDNGHITFQGDRDAFTSSSVIKNLTQTQCEDVGEKHQVITVEDAVPAHLDRPESSVMATQPAEDSRKGNKPARKLVEEEARAVGRVKQDVWLTLFRAHGNYGYWILFFCAFGAAALVPVLENSWLRRWSTAAIEGANEDPSFYISVYAIITTVGLCIAMVRWFVLYNGSIRASTVLYKQLLEAVLFTSIRVHDTISRGRLLNRFGKDFEGIDSRLADDFGKTIINALSAATTIVTVSVVGGLPFLLMVGILGVVYYNAAKVYGQASRDIRRLDSVSRSPLYSIYGETIAGVPVLRAYGASSKLLRDMIRLVDTNSNAYYWMWGVSRWLSIRFNLLSAVIIVTIGIACLVTPDISASLAGFALAFASTLTNDLLFAVRQFVGLEQSMVALERINEYSMLKREPVEFMEPRPPASWPSKGQIQVDDLVVRYAPDLPDVLHNLSFTVQPGEKVGILGRTGSGKSTLALSLFRFVEPAKGRILVDDVDITQVGLTDLRGRMTIIPQDPTILGGTLRSALDIFEEYQDAEIYEALRRVHLIPAGEDDATLNSVNANVFRNLDSVVSEGGGNFSTGERQLLCMARAILKRSKILVMDEATASVDYATDELIGKTIREGFSESTILTVAHRIRTIIDYDRVIILDEGRIVEFDKPKTLLGNKTSQFYALCKATGEEFSMLVSLAGL